MAFTRTDSADLRAELFGRLSAHNRRIGLLRALVPALGVLAFLLLAGQIYLANLARQYGVSGIHIDRGNLVVDTPRYSGSGSDGSHYTINASAARSPLTNTALIDMTNATLDLTRPGATAFHAAAAEALMNTTSNEVTVPGVTHVTSDDGLSGTLVKLRSDMKAQRTTADGPVNLTFADGTTLIASGMIFDGKADIWTFANTTLTMSGLPDAAPDNAASSAERAP
jgi:hypothetical protein